jgi:LPS export ABC transporter protein LptC
VRARRLLPAALSALVVVTAAACQPTDPTPPVASELLEVGADMVLFDIEHYFTTDGVRQAILHAAESYHWNDSAHVALRDLRLRVFTETGEDRATVTSEEGTLDTHTDRMVARRNAVLLVPGEGLRIESPELHYDQERDRIWSDSATLLVRGDQTSHGSAFESDLEFRNVFLRDARTGRGTRF